MTVSPRCLDRQQAAYYLSVSVDQLDRLIYTGQLAIVRLPVERQSDGRGRVGINRRALIDVKDLDRLVDACRERR
jgi:hypothetical protein